MQKDQIQFTDSQVFTTAQAAKVLGVNKRTLDNWRSLGRGPAYMKYSKRQVRYLGKDLSAYKQVHRIEPQN